LLVRIHSRRLIRNIKSRQWVGQQLLAGFELSEAFSDNYALEAARRI